MRPHSYRSSRSCDIPHRANHIVGSTACWCTSFVAGTYCKRAWMSGMAAAEAAATTGRRCDRPCRCTAASGTRRAAGWDCARRAALVKGAPRRSTRPWRASDGRSAPCDMASSCAVAGGMSAVWGDLRWAQRGGRGSEGRHGGAAHNSGDADVNFGARRGRPLGRAPLGVGAEGLAGRTTVSRQQ